MSTGSESDLSNLAQAGRAIAATAPDPQEFAEITYLEIARLIPVDFFQIGLFDVDQYRTLILIQDGTRTDNQSYALNTEKENITGWVRRTGEALLVHDFIKELEALPAQPSYEAEDPPRSGLFIPLSVGNTTMGILALQSRTPNAFTKVHLQLLSILGHSIAAALANLIYRQETESLTLQLILAQEISRILMSLEPLADRLQQVITLIAEVLNFTGVHVYKVVEDQIDLHTTTRETHTLEFETAIPGIVQRCVTERRSLSTNISEDDKNGDEFEYAFPLHVVDHLLGILLLQGVVDINLEGDLGQILAMLANQLAFTMLEARNYDERQEEAWMTTVLLEVAKHAAQPGDTMVALQAVLQLATLLAGTDWALLLLPDESGENVWIGVHAGFKRQQTLAFESIRVSIEAFEIEVPLSDSDAPVQITLPDPMFAVLGQSEALCLKLTDGSKLLGLLLLQDSPLPGIRPSLLAGIGHQVSLRLENARLIEEAALRRSLERELMMARDIQSSFLPESMPKISGWELASAWEVAREVGGDFYDIIPLPPSAKGERWGIVIADVADKGIPAALYMALCRTMLRSVAQTHILPAKTLEIVNQQLISDTRADLFVSAFYGVWEPASGMITFANAGHPPPFLFKSGDRAELIRQHGMVLGVMPEISFIDQTLEFAPGDLLVLYTDGVSEAQNSDQELFGFQRLESLILSESNWNADAIAGAIVDRVVNFSGGRDFSDDLTTVTMRRIP